MSKPTWGHGGDIAKGGWPYRRFGGVVCHGRSSQLETQSLKVCFRGQNKKVSRFLANWKGNWGQAGKMFIHHGNEESDQRKGSTKINWARGRSLLLFLGQHWYGVPVIPMPKKEWSFYLDLGMRRGIRQVKRVFS